MSEVVKTINIVRPYLQGNVLDLGSRGDPVVPWAIQFDLHRFSYPPAPPVQMVWSVETLPFKDETVDAVYSSHCLEDFYDWHPILADWWRVIKPLGHLIIQIPEKDRFRAAVKSGQPDNKDHKHEGREGELTDYSKYFPQCRVIFDECCPEDDYNILFIAQKL